jgi:hypothetical protein
MAEPIHRELFADFFNRIDPKRAFLTIPAGLNNAAILDCEMTHSFGSRSMARGRVWRIMPDPIDVLYLIWNVRKEFSEFVAYKKCVNAVLVACDKHVAGGAQDFCEG